MRVCVFAMVLVGCGDSAQSKPDLAMSDLSVEKDLSVLHGCNTLVLCEANCSASMPACNDACYDGTSASGKALLQQALDCLAGQCTTMTLDGGGTACSAAEGTALQDPKNANTVQLSQACVDCVQSALTGVCHAKQLACIADKS
jgi:hypothetical protein